MKKIHVRGDRARIDGTNKVYRATVLQITERDPDGTPRAFRLLRDDESVHLQGGEAFEVVFARADLQERRH